MLLYTVSGHGSVVLSLFIHIRSRIVVTSNSYGRCVPSYRSYPYHHIADTDEIHPFANKLCSRPMTSIENMTAQQTRDTTAPSLFLFPPSRTPSLRSAPEHREPSDQTRSKLFVLSLGMSDVVELGQGSHQASSVPDGETLSFVGNDVDLDSARLCRRNHKNKGQLIGCSGWS